MAFISSHPRAWKGLVKAGVADMAAAERANSSRQVPPPPAAQAQCCCYDCGAAFSSRSRLSTHAYSVHGRRAQANDYIKGTHCPVCKGEFATRTRVLFHVQFASRRCLQQLIDFHTPLEQAERAELIAQDTADNRQLRSTGIHRLSALQPHLKSGA